MHGTGAPLGQYTHVVPDEAKRAARDVAVVLDKAQRVLVLGHAGADGDVCGSSLGLAQALRERGKDVVVYNEEPYPEAYRWLVGGHDVVTTLGAEEKFDATVVVDAARPDRLGRDFPTGPRRGTFVWIDHHRTVGDTPGDVAYVDLTAAAVGEQIAEVLDAMGHTISPEVARCLYASLLADTGGFPTGCGACALTINPAAASATVKMAANTLRRTLGALTMCSPRTCDEAHRFAVAHEWAHDYTRR